LNTSLNDAEVYIILTVYMTTIKTIRYYVMTTFQYALGEYTFY